MWEDKAKLISDEEHLPTDVMTLVQPSAQPVNSNKSDMYAQKQ